jgi:murein DD-endopeptidase MepM/ murein hydrolase activator NlpD
MTQRFDSSRPSLKSLSQNSLLKGLGFLGGISVLSGGMAFAQTAPTSDALTVPSAQDLLAPAEPASQASPVRPSPAASVAPSPVAEPVMPSPSTSPAAPRPQASAEPDAPQLSLPSSVADQVNTIAPPETTGYIDSTSQYSLGATPSYGQPSSIVLSERSTGCQAVIQQGQNVPNSICATNPTASAKPGSVGSISVGAMRLSANGVGVGRDFYNLTQRPIGLAGNGNVRLMFPLSLPAVITSAFGWRIHPITGASRFHYGTDLGAPMGTPVLAAYSGRVAIADFMRGYGLTVMLRHNNNTAESLYAHMSEIFVQSGEWVEQGQVIGRVGSTGNSTGPHLHFEFREQTRDGWVALNPGGMLQNAIANFSQHFQLAQAPSSQEKRVSFGLEGFDEVLKVLQDDPASLKFQKVKFGTAPISFDIDVDDTKEWIKTLEEKQKPAIATSSR